MWMHRIFYHRTIMRLFVDSVNLALIERCRSHLLHVSSICKFYRWLMLLPEKWRTVTDQWYMFRLAILLSGIDDVCFNADRKTVDTSPAPSIYRWNFVVWTMYTHCTISLICYCRDYKMSPRAHVPMRRTFSSRDVGLVSLVTTTSAPLLVRISNRHKHEGTTPLGNGTKKRFRDNALLDT